MALPAEWNIQSPAPQCAATGQPFAEGDKVVSVLLQDKKGDWRRLDYAADQWPPKQGELPHLSPLQEEGVEVLSSWRSLYKPRHHDAAHSALGAEPLTKDNAEGLLRRLLAERNPGQPHSNEKACYILALMLERKRVVKELDRREIEGQPCLIYEHVPSGETWIIPNPPLRLDEMTRVQAEVMELLAGPQPAAAAEAAPSPAEASAEGTPEITVEEPASALGEVLGGVETPAAAGGEEAAGVESPATASETILSHGEEPVTDAGDSGVESVSRGSDTVV